MKTASLLTEFEDHFQHATTLRDVIGLPDYPPTAAGPRHDQIRAAHDHHRPAPPPVEPAAPRARPSVSITAPPSSAHPAPSSQPQNGTRPMAPQAPQAPQAPSAPSAPSAASHAPPPVRVHSVDMMKWTTVIVMVIVVGLVAFKFYSFIKRRKSAAGAKKRVADAVAPLKPSISLTPTSSGSPSRSAPAPLATAPAPAAHSPPVPSPQKRTKTPQKRAPASPGVPATLPATLPATQQHPTSPADAGSLDDELEGFLGQMQEDERRVRQELERKETLGPRERTGAGAGRAGGVSRKSAREQRAPRYEEAYPTN